MDPQPSAGHLVLRVMHVHQRLQDRLSGNDPRYNFVENSDRLQIAMICHTTSGLFSPQSNGQMEITIQAVKSQLGKNN